MDLNTEHFLQLLIQHWEELSAMTAEPAGVHCKQWIDNLLSTQDQGSDCGSVGSGSVSSAVASYTRDLQVEPTHWQNFIF